MGTRPSRFISVSYKALDCGDESSVIDAVKIILPASSGPAMRRNGELRLAHEASVVGK
ncbi:hypothetical protein D3C71_2170890 [compost metagenome]